MNSNRTDELKSLLDRFYDGMTTETEESRLRELLADDGLPDYMAADKALLDAMAQDTACDVPEGLESRLSAAIDGWEEAEKKRRRAGTRVRIISMRRIASVAASVAVVLAIGFGVNHYGGSMEQPEMADTFTDPNDAYMATEKALTIFANAINRSMDGMETAEYISDRALDKIKTN